MTTLRNQRLAAHSLICEINTLRAQQAAFAESRLKLQLNGLTLPPSDAEQTALRHIEDKQTALRAYPDALVAGITAHVELQAAQRDAQRLAHRIHAARRIPSAILTDPTAIAAHADELRAMLQTQDMLKAEIERLAPLAIAPRNPRNGGRRSGAGRPRGGARPPMHYADQLDPLLLDYDQETGALSYDGRPCNPDSPRVTQHAVPRGVAIALARGHYATAKPTRPADHPHRWAWDSLVLTNRYALRPPHDRLPDCDTAGNPVNPHAVPAPEPTDARREQWRKAQARRRKALDIAD